MTERKDTPAFPVVENLFAPSASGNYAENVGQIQHQGMTLRDYFAAQAILVAFQSDSDFEAASKECYRFADSMIAQREVV